MGKKTVARDPTRNEIEFFEEHPLEAIGRFNRIQHRDKPRGFLTPLEFNALQWRQYNLIQTIRAINLTEHLRLDEVARKLICSITGLDIAGSWGFRQTVDALLQWGIPKIMARARRDPDNPTLNDGPVQIMAVKQRRGGCSTGFMALEFHEAHWFPQTRVEVHAQKGRAVENLLEIAGRFYGSWPRDEIQFRNDTKSKTRERMEWTFGSKFEVFTAGSKDATRSFEADIYLLSEYAHYPDHGGVNAALAAGQKHAWIFKESTANGSVGAFHDEYWDAMNVDDVIEMFEHDDFEARSKWSGYYRFFFGWTEDPGYQMPCSEKEAEYILSSLDRDEQRLAEDIPGVTPEQLKWRRWKIANLTDDKMLSRSQMFLQEFPHTPESAFQSRGSQVYDQARLDALAVRSKQLRQVRVRLVESNWGRKRQPLEEASVHASTLSIWERPRPTDIYIVSGDIGHGLPDGDWSVLSVFKRSSITRLIQVAEYRGRIAPKRVGDVAWMLAKWYNDAYAIMEVNGPGLVANDRLVNDNRWPHVYHRAPEDRMGADMGLVSSFLFGFHTTGKSKDMAVGNLKQAFVEDLCELRSLVGINECKLYQGVETAAGNIKYGAPKGRYDDCAMAYALGMYAHLDQTKAPAFFEAKRRQEMKAKQDKASPQDRELWDFIESKKATARKHNRKHGRNVAPEP